jgi:hypothetical protein
MTNTTALFPRSDLYAFRTLLIWISLEMQKSEGPRRIVHRRPRMDLESLDLVL